MCKKQKENDMRKKTPAFVAQFLAYNRNVVYDSKLS